MSRFEAAPAIRLMPTEDGALVIDLQTDLYYALNGTGLDVWNALSAGGTIEQAAGGLASASGVDRDRALTLVARFVESAMSASLLVERDDRQKCGGTVYA